jgi:hypothetical protein
VNYWTISYLSGIILSPPFQWNVRANYENSERSMDFTFQQINELTTAHGIPGYQALQRGISRKVPYPLGDDLPQSKLGCVICQNNGIYEAPRVMLDDFINKDNYKVQHTIKVGFINFFARRQNV